MPNEIYNAFVKAGFVREARSLSETIRTKDRLKRKTGLGHYIAVLDNNLEYTNQTINSELKNLVMVSGIEIREFINFNLRSKISEEIKKAQFLAKELERWLI